ncbi:MAG: N-6 DNA methylase [Candidatus Hodarchaeales archaeon]|jgi:type I restriction enzyme M protein
MILRRRDLIPPKDLKEIFYDIRNHLAGNFKGITRDNQLLEQLIFILFCKIFDELETQENDIVKFQIGELTDGTLIENLNLLFSTLKKKYSNILDPNDQLLIDSPNLDYIASKLGKYAISEASRDVIGDAFEQFLLPSLRGSQGQFFTPKNISSTIIGILNPKSTDRIIDPACGAGGFLTGIISSFSSLASYSNIFGIDKDRFLVKISRLHLALLNAVDANIICENSLKSPATWSTNINQTITFNSFDIVLTNPPFGVKITVSDPNILQNYQLGYKWVKKNSSWEKSIDLRERQPLQVLFIEQCLNFLKPGGKLGIILPEGIFGNPSERYIIDYLLKNFKILAIISCSSLAFMPHTHIKTSLLFIEKSLPPKDYPFFVAISSNMGHDKNGKILYKTDNLGKPILDDNGNKIINDDLPIIIRNFHMYTEGTLKELTTLGFRMNRREIINNILIPTYYDPSIKSKLEAFQNQGYILFSLNELVKEEIISIQRGHEVGAKFYGTGSIPFVRTSDIFNLEINLDPLKQVNEDVYTQYKDKQNIKSGDILIVNDGTFLIGKTAMVTKEDEKIVIQSHIKKIRVLKKHVINEYLLLWSLNTQIVQTQINSKKFIQATISTLGDRLLEVILVIPGDPLEQNKLTEEIREIILNKQELKVRYKQLLRII